MKKKKIIMILSILLVFIGLLFMRHRLNKNTKGNDVTSYQYKAIKIVNSSGKAYIDVDGSVEANDTKKVYVNKKLRVKEIFVKVNDYVKKGDLLMTFDENDRNTIKRNIQKEKLNLQKLMRNLNVAKKLYNIGGSSINAVKELEEEVLTSRIVLEEYNEDLNKTVENIKSPVDGTIVSLTAEENYAVNTEQPLLEITDLTQLKIIFELPEYEVLNVKIGQKIDIIPELYEKKKTFKGSIVDISKVSKTSSSTSENVLEVEVTPDEPIPSLAPGFKVSGIIYLEADNDGINIAKTALLNDGKYYVFVINEKNNEISKKYVEIGDVQPGDTVKITSGLNLGEIVLATPTSELKNGDKIEYVLIGSGTRKGKKGNNRQGGGFGGPPM